MAEKLSEAQQVMLEYAGLYTQAGRAFTYCDLNLTTLVSLAKRGLVEGHISRRGLIGIRITPAGRALLEGE